MADEQQTQNQVVIATDLQRLQPRQSVMLISLFQWGKCSILKSGMDIVDILGKINTEDYVPEECPEVIRDTGQ